MMNMANEMIKKLNLHYGVIENPIGGSILIYKNTYPRRMEWEKNAKKIGMRNNGTVVIDGTEYTVYSKSGPRFTTVELVAEYNSAAPIIDVITPWEAWYTYRLARRYAIDSKQAVQLGLLK